VATSRAGEHPQCRYSTPAGSAGTVARKNQGQKTAREVRAVSTIPAAGG